MRVRFAFGATLFLFWPSIGLARPLIRQDAEGKWQVVDTKSLPGPVAMGAAGAYRLASHIDIQVTYRDVSNATGVGFDDPATGAARRAVLDAVLLYLDGLILSDGALQIEARNSQTDGGGPLASASPALFSVGPYEDTLAVQHLTSGVDPDVDSADIFVTVDFGYLYHLDPATDTPGNRYDLFSVLLHEILHGVGITSLATASGASAAAPDVVFTRFDSFLYTGNGGKLWNGAGAFNGTAGWMTGGDGGIVFRGPQASAVFGSFPPVYTPATYQPGSSIAHWSNAIPGPPSMNPFASQGQMTRQLAPFEIGALRDLGLETVEPVQVNGVLEWAEY
jgi:hypothetical protein